MQKRMLALGFAAGVVASGAAFLVTGVSAQTALAPPAGGAVPVTLGAADIAALIAKAKTDIKPGRPSVTEAAVNMPPYRLGMDYRIADGGAEIHVGQAEYMIVIQGGATLTTGGKLINPNATGTGGSGIEGGTVKVLHTGDIAFIPENTPHSYTAITGGAMVDLSLHIPRPVPGAAP